MTSAAKGWSECGQLYFCGDIGYGLTDALQTISLGSEEGIKAFLEGRETDKEYTVEQRQVLIRTKDYRKEVLDNARTVEIKRPGDFRGRPARVAKYRTTSVRYPASGKRVPSNKTKS